MPNSILSCCYLYYQQINSGIANLSLLNDLLKKETSHKTWILKDNLKPLTLNEMVPARRKYIPQRHIFQKQDMFVNMYAS